jgi:undecaprenyl phosphate N,N'-diacetylbacillosamine 1-phosphate transferase
MKSSRVSSAYARFFKPLIDFIFALVMLIPVAPLFIFVMLLLAVANNGKVFFRQSRVGRSERLFTLIKFRTMNDKRDEFGSLLPDEQRLTSIGRFIRKTSLDEIPQIINVVKGDMSFIGPRPLLPEYLAYYDARQRHRHLVKPGITGWAQVNGRNLASWEKRFELDIEYVEAMSFVFDLKIFFITIIKVFRAEGISAEGHATMPKFSDYVKSKNQK